MKNIFLVILAAAAMWIASMFTGDNREMSLDYVPRDGYEDSYYDEMEEIFRDWDKHRKGDTVLEYRSRGGSGNSGNSGGFRSGGGRGDTTLDYRGRSSRTGRYVSRDR